MEEDVRSVFLDTRDYELIVWPIYVLGVLARSLLAPCLDHNNYLSDDPDVEASKLRYRQFLLATWNYYRAAKPVDVVIAGNYAYAQQREFGAALEEAGTPFIVIHKENVRPPRRVKHYWQHIYKERRGPFAGRRIIVYNEVERDLQVASGVFDPERIIVAGMPRLDRIHRWRRENAGASIAEGETPQILFLSFSTNSKLTAPGRKRTNTMPKGRYAIDGGWGNLSWDGVWRETHGALIRAAKENPGLRLIIKVKGRLDKDKKLKQLLEAEPVPRNLEIVAGGDPFHLIVASRVVIGFNTTGLLEAIAAGKPVIVPRFLEAADPARQDLIIDLGDAVSYASSPEDLIRLAIKCAEQPKVRQGLTGSATEVLRYWVGNEDGNAGCRALRAIESALSASGEIVQPAPTLRL